MIRLKIEDALGHRLAHDITEIRPGEFKGAAFLKGHTIDPRDLDHLRRLGKNHIYVITPETGKMHEDDAVLALAGALCGSGVSWTGAPREGKISLTAAIDGLFLADVPMLTRFNEIGQVMCASLHSCTVVNKGMTVAGTRAIPLLADAEIIAKAVRIARSAENGVLSVVPMKEAAAGVLITGNEVCHGLIEDKFEAVIRKKVAERGGSVREVVFLPDDDEMIKQAALRMVEAGIDVLITTGGMSVDPDDRTRFALAKAGAKDIVYGAGVLPGAMFMAASLKGVPVLGVPACALHHRITVFDLIYPRVLAGLAITRKTLAALGHGGLCMGCRECAFPRCPFGK